MLGIIRFFLASCVVAFHLSGKISYLGQFSVNFFYVISGFLITLILNKTYNFNGFRFATNRFLRLYPTYYFFLLVGMIVIFALPHSHEFHGSWTGKLLSGDGLANAFIFPWALVREIADPNPFGIFFGTYPFVVDGSRFRIITSSWSVGVELVCYFFLWLFIARNWVIACLTVLLSAIYHIYVFYTIASPSAAYIPVIAAILPFSMGAAGFFIYDKIVKARELVSYGGKAQFILLFLFISAFLINWVYFNLSQSTDWHPMHYYVNNVIALIAVIALVDSKPKGKTGKISRFLGDMSYPLFLCQYFGGYFAWMLLGFGDQKRGWEIFFIGYIISLIMAAICVNVVDRNISSLRSKVRHEQRPL